MATAFLVVGPTKMLPLVNAPPEHHPLCLQGGMNGTNPITPLITRGGLSQTNSGSITIASLNMKGANSVNMQNKWKQIIHCMKTKKITILCVLNSHSDDNQIICLNNKYNPLFKFIHTSDNDNTHSKGIVIVKNNNLIPNELLDITDLAPGRAIKVMVKWLKESYINILAMYTPNPPRENEKFWKHLTEHFSQNNASQPDIMLGDFNIVKQAID